MCVCVRGGGGGGGGVICWHKIMEVSLNIFYRVHFTVV